jgi:hypothetical protein
VELKRRGSGDARLVELSKAAAIIAEEIRAELDALNTGKAG